MPWKINEPAILDLDIGFTRSLGPVGDAIALCSGGWQAVRDRSFPTHAFFFCRIQGRLFAVEEGIQGLLPMPLSEYANDSNRIVAVYRCQCWDDPKRRDGAIAYLTDTWAAGGERQKYAWHTLFHKIPGIGRLIRPDDVETICSQNVAQVLQKCGEVSWFAKCGTELRPDELLDVLKAGRMLNQVETVLHYQDAV
jgi:hypothetical protein